MYKNIVLAIPHSVGKVLSSWDNTELLNKDVNEWTDWHTDIIFCPTPHHGKITQIIGDVSRFDCDLERLENDPLESSGRGIVYTKSHSGAIKISSHDSMAQLVSIWRNYRNKLTSAISEDTLIIDCHSYPSTVSDIEINIGFNEDSTKPSKFAIDKVYDHFVANGYVVGVNEPYSNSIAPVSDIIYSSLMIEVNKKLYLDENTYMLKSCAYKIHYCIQDLYQKLLGEK